MNSLNQDVTPSRPTPYHPYNNYTKGGGKGSQGNWYYGSYGDGYLGTSNEFYWRNEKGSQTFTNKGKGKSKGEGVDS